MNILGFENSIAWKKSRVLTNKLYKIFGDSKDYSFKDQILRASVSIMNNISEGFDRGTDKEFKYFLYIARGSNAEVRSMLFIAMDQNYITKEEYTDLLNINQEIGRLLTGFIKKL